MIKLTQIAKMLNQSWHEKDCDIGGFSTDSRVIQANDLFIALKGEQFNGHDFLQQAEQQGAVAAIVDEVVTTALPTLKVADTTMALGELARVWRLQFHPAIVAITGSCGKTSTRALMQAILSTCGPTLASERSFNNNIGVPLTLLRLRAEHQYAVLEIGANHPGEILPLVKAVQPRVAIITNAGNAHLAGFGNIEGVARAKSEIYQTLQANDVAVVNQDDAFAGFWQNVAKGAQLLTFGIHTTADIRATNISLDDGSVPRFLLQTPKGDAEIQLQMMGKHSIYNALAAAAAAIALDIPLANIKQGLQSALPENRRLIEQKGYAAATVIDDSYNANPTSVKAAIDILAGRRGLRTLVLGDMMELGDLSDHLHQEIGAAAKKAGIDYLFCYGSGSRFSVAAFGENGQHFASKEALVAALRPLLNDNMTVLVKGSNSMGMNQVAQSLL